MTMGTSWTYKPNDRFKSAGELIRNLCRIVARNGNYLIGIGPDGSGEFDPTVYARLKALGAWLKLNGEAIYGTRPIKPYEQNGCVFTRKPDGTAYAIILPRDDEGKLPAAISIPAELARGRSLSLLGFGRLEAGAEKDGRMVVAIPAAVRDKPPCDSAWTIKLSTIR
jgi:alpha-L-fucosidase